jgi:beta-fructofuranosidase
MHDSAPNGQLPSIREITRREFIAAGAAALASAKLAQAGPPPSNRIAADRNRPQYHLMPPANWMNDPNGPFKWKGRYHLFYQYAAVVSNTGTKYWGHALSTDLVHWKNLGIALAPTPSGPDNNGCWTGSAVVANGLPTLVYTGATWSEESERAARAKGLVPERQMVAVSADPDDPDQRRWTKIPQDPVLATPPSGMEVVGWRDPSLWKERDSWYMVIGSGEAGIGGMALLYSSKDLRNWTYLHPLAVAERVSKGGPSGFGADMWECPDFFFLDGKPILLVARGNSYLRGTYSGHRFQQGAGGQIDYGAAYAQKTMQDEKGRRIWWGWIHEKRSMQAQAAAGWAGVMSLPKQLTLGSDGTLGVEPVAEVKLLRRGHKELSNQEISPNGALLLEYFEGDCAEIEAEIELGDSKQAGLRVRSTADGSEQTLIGYDRDSQMLFSDTTNSSTDPETLKGPFPGSGRGLQRGTLKIAAGDLLRLRIYIDASVIETFANDRVSISDRAYPVNTASSGIGLFSRGGTAHLRSMTVWQLAPISTDRLTSGAELYRV